MAETTGEEITSAFIDSLESDLKDLKSKEEDVARLVDELRTVEGKINDLERRINSIDQFKPSGPGVLSLEQKLA